MSVGSNPTPPTIKYTNSYLINHVNIALSRKYLKTTIRVKRGLFKLIKILYKIGVLKNFIIFTNHLILCRFSIFFYKNKSFYKAIRLITTGAKKFYISLNALHKLTLTSKSSVYILSTPKGLLTHTEALKLGSGGVLLMVVS